MGKSNLCEKLKDSVINIIHENWPYFRQNPKHLAWAFMNYELFHRVGNKLDPSHCVMNNPAYPVVDLREELGGKDHHLSDLIYESWGICVSNYDLFYDTNPDFPLEAKHLKTFDEWAEVLTDKRFRYHKLFPYAKQVKNYLLRLPTQASRKESRDYENYPGLRISSILWNKEGFLSHFIGEDLEKAVYFGYTKAEAKVKDDIKKKILRLRGDPRIKRHIEAYLGICEENAKKFHAGDPQLGSNEFGPFGHSLSLMGISIHTVDLLYKGFSEKTDRELQAEFGEYFRLTEHPFEGLRTFSIYPPFSLTEHSNLVTMPTNAHPTYVKAGKEIANEILRNREENAESKKYAKEFLRQFG